MGHQNLIITTTNLELGLYATVSFILHTDLSFSLPSFYVAVSLLWKIIPVCSGMLKNVGISAP
jgi:hypothetical protein